MVTFSWLYVPLAQTTVTYCSPWKKRKIKKITITTMKKKTWFGRARHNAKLSLDTLQCFWQLRNTAEQEQKEHVFPILTIWPAVSYPLCLKMARFVRTSDKLFTLKGTWAWWATAEVMKVNAPLHHRRAHTQSYLVCECFFSSSLFLFFEKTHNMDLDMNCTTSTNIKHLQVIRQGA